MRLTAADEAKRPGAHPSGQTVASTTIFVILWRLFLASRVFNQHAAIAVLIAATFALRSFALFTTSIDADEGVYLVIAQQWLHGGLPYITVWDQHPPGLPAVLKLVMTMIDDPVLGARLAAAVAIIATSVLMYQFSLRYLRNAGAGLIGAICYIISVSRWAGLSANTEIFNNFIVAFAAYHLLAAARQPPDARRAVVAALALGIGLQIKYVIFPEAILLSLGYLAISFARNHDLWGTALTAGAMIFAGCLPTAIAIGYFWHEGALQPFLEANIGSNITYVSLIPPLREILYDSASGMLPIIGPVLIIFYAILRCARWRPSLHSLSSPEMWLLLWIIAAALDICVPMKFFRHYFFALYPPASLAAAIALAALANGRPRRFAFGLVTLFAVALPAWAVGILRAAPWSGQDVPRIIADELREAGAQDGDLYVYRYQPAVYALAGIRPPTPYVMTLELSEFSESAHVDGVTEMQRIMANRPRFVVRPAETVGGQAAAVEEVLNRTLANYRLVREFTDVADRSVIQIFER